MTITITERPMVGRFQRSCKACGEPYFTWNFVLCPLCESNAHMFEIVEAWRS